MTESLLKNGSMTLSTEMQIHQKHQISWATEWYRRWARL